MFKKYWNVYEFVEFSIIQNRICFPLLWQRRLLLLYLLLLLLFTTNDGIKIYAITHANHNFWKISINKIVNNTELLKAPTPPQSNDNSIKFDGNNADGDTLCASYFATNRSIFFNKSQTLKRLNTPLIVLSAGGVQNTSNYYDNTRNYQSSTVQGKPSDRNSKKKFWIVWVWLNTNCFWAQRNDCLFSMGVHYGFIFKTPYH